MSSDVTRAHLFEQLLLSSDRIEQFKSLSQLLPCWMASPESVAEIFPMAQDFFDLVVFDEASQCYVERALPVMLRGKQCVIAGDDKQLPPFDLYGVKVDEYETEVEDVGVALEVESALDLARNVFLDCHLGWHYRSREEDLINFSNHAFYEGRLKTIPAATRRKEPALSFLRVNGLWEKNRNVVEARRVVELIEELVPKILKTQFLWDKLETSKFYELDFIQNL